MSQDHAHPDQDEAKLAAVEYVIRQADKAKVGALN
jgi:hypothetical protein